MIKKIKVSKTYKGLVELRDYDVKTCIDTNTSIQIEYAGDTMTLLPIQLKNDVSSTSKLFASKIDSKSYKLYGYIWEPDNAK